MAENMASSDFLRVLLALKENIMRDINVADICQIKQIQTGYAYNKYFCTSITDGAELEAIAITDVALSVGDLVCVIFTNYEFKPNLTATNKWDMSNKKLMHTKLSSIIIGKVPQKES